MYRSPSRPVIFGEVLFDHFADGSRVLGGAPFNVAWHLRGFGASPLVVSGVGQDAEGREVLDRMISWDLRTDGVQTDASHPTGSVVASAVDGENRYEIAADQAWDFIRLEPARVAFAQEPNGLLYHGTLALRSEESWNTVRALTAEVGAPVFVDINLREPWWTREKVDWCLRTSNWVKLNDEELALLTSRATDEHDACRDAALALARADSIDGVIVTLSEFVEGL